MSASVIHPWSKNVAITPSLCWMYIWLASGINPAATIRSAHLRLIPIAIMFSYFWTHFQFSRHTSEYVTNLRQTRRFLGQTETPPSWHHMSCSERRPWRWPILSIATHDLHWHRQKPQLSQIYFSPQVTWVKVADGFAHCACPATYTDDQCWWQRNSS